MRNRISLIRIPFIIGVLLLHLGSLFVLNLLLPMVAKGTEPTGRTGGDVKEDLPTRGAGKEFPGPSAIQTSMINVRVFGAVGDGQTNDTKSFQRASEEASRGGKSIYVPTGLYLLDGVQLGDGCQGIIGPGVLKATSAKNDALVIVRGRGTSTSPLRNLRICINVDGAGIARKAILLNGVYDSVVEECYIKNVKLGAIGIYLGKGCEGNIVRGNFIELAKDPGKAPGTIGINLNGDFIDSYAGWFLEPIGTIKSPQEFTVRRNIITNNIIRNGTHGISLNGAASNLIIGNIVTSQTHRGILLSPNSTHNEITGNLIEDFGSSGIHMAYGSSWNNVVGNKMISRSVNRGADGGAIQSYVGSVGNNISGNHIQGNFNYGVYLGIQSGMNKVSNNVIIGDGNISRVGIALEAQWASRRPDMALYSRKNSTDNVRASSDISGNEISGNYIVDCVCGIYLATIDETVGIDRTILNQNTVSGVFSHALYMYDNMPGKTTKVSIHTLRGNVNKEDADRDTGKKIYISNPSTMISGVLDADGLLDGVTRELTVQNDVAGVLNGRNFTTPPIVLPIVISELRGGWEGKEIRLYCSNANTTLKNSRRIRLRGEKDFKCSSDAWVELKYFVESNFWLEISRSSPY